MQEIENITPEDMISNTEILERQFYYLSTLKSYLEDQLKQVSDQLEKTAAQLPKSD